MGDIAMTVPVLWSFAKRYPQHEITLLSRESAATLFQTMPANVHFLGVNLNDYRGVVGLARLVRKLERNGYDAVADLHDVLRSKYIRMTMHTQGYPVAYINKSRGDRRALTRSRNKRLAPMQSSIERYQTVLAELGYPFTLTFKSIFEDYEPAMTPEMSDFIGQNTGYRIGIAPFARHQGKIYPLRQMDGVIQRLASDRSNKIYLFGAGAEERQWCEEHAAVRSNVVSAVGHFNLQQELQIISRLQVMVTMDSANMHLASLVGTPTVSIWGATHPYAGFAGLQPEKSVILQHQMSCRPCSIFGNKECYKGTYECLWAISPEEVAEAVTDVCKRQSDLR
ncbi:MAG: glycosyltransferase family 9 protein [Prevotellaceae bacterium]|nr:glycosyltransferase family 9 protein [Prevotellaceae bacterium]MDY3856771.1 glycosyltransferase family 9 protein [Bacteroidaceae bacterium]